MTSFRVFSADPTACRPGKTVTTATEKALGARLALLEARLAAVLQHNTVTADKVIDKNILL